MSVKELHVPRTDATNHAQLNTEPWLIIRVLLWFCL